MLETLKISDFQPLVNQALTIRFASEISHPAELIKVTPWGSASDKFRQPFTLELETDLTRQYYLQGSFVLVHPTAGELPLFMVPIGPGSKGMRYEIVIS